ncbi:MAG: tyrosine-type recombinase/integrase [Paludibacter sp.]|nr:tyrosine-type recombinase/integrase [Paludibacter sp.]
MKYISIIPYKSTTLKNGDHPIVLRITKDRARKYISLNLSTTLNQWNEEFSQFKKDKRLNPDHEKNNAFLYSQVLKAKDVIDDFDRSKIDWTLNQFETAFLHRSKKGKVKPFFENHIHVLKETDHNGNARCYESTLVMLEIFDKKLDQRVFSEIDIKYIRAFDIFLQTPRETICTSVKGNTRAVQRKACCGNTRKYYMKALRSILNMAIEAKEASRSTYPFGRGGFEVAKLEEETEKRYLPSHYLIKIKSDVELKKTSQYARRLFLFSYFCYGMSFVDMAHLSQGNIKRLEDGQYIVYKRHKTRNSKKAKAISIKLTDDIQTLISELYTESQPVEGYLLPIISRKGLSAQELFKHINNKLVILNKYLEQLAQELGIHDINLTSYVSRHTMAMTLQNNNIPREVISQILNHKDLATTNTYLDSFNSKVIDEAVKVL